MRQDWLHTTLGAIAAAGGHGLVDGPFGSNLPASAYRADGVPVIRGSNLSVGSGLLDEREFVFVDEPFARKLSRSLCYRGDIIFTKKGTLGQTGFIGKRSKFPAYLLSSNQMKLSVNPEIADPTFVYYYVSSNESISKIIRDAEATGVPKTNLAYLRTFPIRLPSLDEQVRIGALLASLDDKIEINNQLNETLEAMAQAIFRDWFIDFGPTRRKVEGETDPVEIVGRLVTNPEHAKRIADIFPAKFSDIGLPDGWSEVPVSRLIEFNPSEPLKRGRVALYSDMASLPTSGSLAAPPISREFNSGMRFRNGDALMARITPCLENGKAAFVNFLPDATSVGWGSTEFIVLRARPPVPPPFAYLLVRHPEFRERAIRSMTGTSGRQRVQADSVSTFSIAQPTPDVFQAFGSFVEPYFSLISAKGKESITLAATRDLILPKLMSREIQLSDAEALAEAAE